MDQYLKLYAMEFFLKHWDGYADNTNNTYLYNDATAVAAPGVGDIKFKMIPWVSTRHFNPRGLSSWVVMGSSRSSYVTTRRAASSCWTRFG
jgi:hypothetical protein